MANFNSGFASDTPNMNETTPINDLASCLTSCWSKDGGEGRQMAFDGGAGYIFPANNYAHTYSGQIIGIANVGSAPFSCGAGNAWVFCDSANHPPGTYFNISQASIYVFMLTTQNYWVQIAKSVY